MRGGRFGLASLALLAATAGCGEEEYAILITAYGETESSLALGTELAVTVRDLKSSLRAQSPLTELGAMEPGDPIRIGIELHSPGQFMVHIVADTSTDEGPERYIATRCYTVTGVTKSEVILVGPISSGEEGADVDGDSFTAEETCHERGIEEVGCNDQCPTIWGTDCGPDDPDTNPGAVEQCEDGIDQDCDEVDAPCEDADGDSYTGCSPDAVDRSTCDCDDSDATVNPGVSETSDPALGLCENDIDEDCSGADQCCDRDGDQVSSCCGEEQIGCDCVDDNPDIQPGASETPGGECDGLDNNCNGLIDEVGACLAPDLDADGSPASCAADPDPPADCLDDCNDCSAAMNPRGRAVCGNRIDEDCSLDGTDDGLPLRVGADPCPEGDTDGDGSVALASGGSDCDDDDADRYPGAPDMCGDGIDYDCSGQDTSCASDGDDDRWNAANDCDDEVATVNPGVETDGCNGVDDDCDGIFDENLAPRTGCVLLQGRWETVLFDTNLLHCGECRHDCNAGCREGTVCRSDVCVGGECMCGVGLVAPDEPDPQCGGGDDDYCCSDGCKDLTSDIMNCGACGVVCEAPTCQFPVCNDGVCGTGFERDGMPLGGGVYCCDGQAVGECDPENYLLDLAYTEGCGVLCGHHDRVCGPECTWGEYGACLEEGECSFVNGDDRQRDCARCGTQTSLCEAGCEWGAWQACINQGPCEVAEVGQQGCGRCGTQYRTCSDSCTWGNWGNCENEGVCTPDEVDTEDCGNCGSRSRTCQANCQWGAWGDCGGQGVCSPGTPDSQPCGNCGGGSQPRTCQDNCTWGAWGTCGGGTCGAATESRNCGTGGSGNDGCGRQSRSCGATCQWSSYGACAADAGRTAECNDSNACTTDTCEADGDCGYANCGGATPACCGAGVGCRACCGADASTCQGNPGVCKDWSCSGNNCVAVNETNNTDPETECAPAGGFQMICCDGACEECCNGSIAGCGSEPTCQDWTCNGSDNCIATDETDGTDPETECPPAGGFPMVCCNGACEECCNGDATDCGTEPVCQNYTCNGSNDCISSNEPNGSQPAACSSDICCDGSCEECCNGDATNCSDPGICEYATCDGNDTCQSANETNGEDPEDECDGNGGLAICCNGACAECCGADITDCGADPVTDCVDWSCVLGVCTEAWGDNGSDPENDCSGSLVCCNGNCWDCCGGPNDDPYSNCSGSQCCDGAGSCGGSGC